jgi:hypothetical protein
MVVPEPRFCETLRLDPPDTRKSTTIKTGNTSFTVRRATRSIWTSALRAGGHDGPARRITVEFDDPQEAVQKLLALAMAIRERF